MQENELSAYRDYAWRYFDRHAEQRLKTLHFYLVLSAALVGGSVAALNSGASAWPFGVALAVLSMIFWLLDNRNRGLIKHGERALKWLESHAKLHAIDGKPHPCLLFVGEAEERVWWTYTSCFRALFLALFVAGVSLTIADCVPASGNEEAVGPAKSGAPGQIGEGK